MSEDGPEVGARRGVSVRSTTRRAPAWRRAARSDEVTGEDGREVGARRGVSVCPTTRRANAPRAVARSQVTS